MVEEQEKQAGKTLLADIKTESLLASKLVCNKPCWLYSVIVGEISASYGEFTLYDNQAASGKIRLRVFVAQYFTEPLIFKHPIRFKKGLYLDFTTNGTYAFVQFRPDY